MSKNDTAIAMGIGALTGIYFFYLFKNAVNSVTGEHLIPEPFFSSLWLIIIIFPFLAAFALWIAALIGRKYASIYQLAKFLLIGVLATIFDLGILNLFINMTGAASGAAFNIFKGISFIVATVLKYIPDKYWAFKKKESSDIKKEFAQFFTVTLTGLVINMSVAHIIVNAIGPQFGLDDKSWGNLGGIGATIITFAWNFIGYKFIVFKK